MSLKTLVKAGNITNLSDARYFAGMGVEIIGFPVGKTAGNTLEPSKIKEIAGWLSGVKIALEFQDFEEEWVKTLLQELPPDFVQVPETIVDRFRKITSLPLLIVTENLPTSVSEKDHIIYTGRLLGNELLKQFCTRNNVFLSGEEIDTKGVLEVLNSIKPYGIELKGSSEISPGLKDFEELSEILELLEVEE